MWKLVVLRALEDSASNCGHCIALDPLVDSALHQLIESMAQVLLGKQEQVRLALCCLLARGHLLIEDRPGMGKSTLAEALARGSALEFKRVSFTSDLLPADLTGINVFDARTAEFRFQPGPLFGQVLLADEINRASPRTQSALLEAMAVGRVSVDGTSRPLPKPFFVIATQNSLDQVGTSPLPEAQLDRFLMRISLGFPSRDAERALLERKGMDVSQLKACLDPIATDSAIRNNNTLQLFCLQGHCRGPPQAGVGRLAGEVESHLRFPVTGTGIPRISVPSVPFRLFATILKNR